MRAALSAALGLCALTSVVQAALPPVRHVFVLLLENESFERSFGPGSPAPYLARALPRRGALLREYYAIGHASLPNYLALVSGQAPNEVTQDDCPQFLEFEAATGSPDEHGQLHGRGCVYPRTLPTLMSQLEAVGLSWKGYMEDMGADPTREAAACGHVPIGARDVTEEATANDQYANKHDPFVYFHAVIDDSARCAERVVNLRQLPQDLRTLGSTPNFVFITPNLCDDGHDAPCADGRPGGLRSIDAFLRHWVPLIESAPAFRADGMLIITFDESNGGGPAGAAACCGERALPEARFPPGLNGPGGGRVGALVLSRFVRPGTVSRTPYNHYALLRTVELLFGLAPIGYAADPQLRPFGPDVFSAAAQHPLVR
ncbi:MAG: phosphoesterase [Gammaproteobacteria bacterium]|nr:phosphoesterase [Gammaproteobacteria bacterium]MBV9621094.1 phosphoesterase [Gammaproteobacteria bacterium]